MVVLLSSLIIMLTKAWRVILPMCAFLRSTNVRDAIERCIDMCVSRESDGPFLERESSQSYGNIFSKSSLFGMIVLLCKRWSKHSDWRRSVGLKRGRERAGRIDDDLNCSTLLFVDSVV